MLKRNDIAVAESRVSFAGSLRGRSGALSWGIGMLAPNLPSPGANAGNILRMILVQGLKVAAVGLAIGFVMALPLPKLFESIFQGQVLFGAPAVYLVVLAVMLIVNFSATLGPARRATRVDPTAALRSE